MAENVVQILVKAKDGTTTTYKAAEVKAEEAGSKISDIFDKMGKQVNEKLGNVGKNLGKGGGIFAGASGILAMAAPLGAAGVAMGAFGAIAIPVLTKVEKAHVALTAAQLQYNKVVQSEGIALSAAGLSAKQKASIEATYSKQKMAALDAEKQATAGLTGSQKDLMGQVDGLQASWGKLENQMTPVIVTVASMAIKLGTALMPVLATLATAGAKLLQGILGPLTQLVQSPFFTQFTKMLAQMAGQMGNVLGPALVGLLKLLMQLFMQTGPSGVKLLQILLPLIIQLATDLVPVIAFVAKLTAAVLTWLQHTHLLLPLLALLAVAVLALDAPVMAVVIAVAVLIAAGVELSRRWRQIWRDVLAAVDGVWSWIRGHWPLLLSILTGPVGAAVVWIVTHWSQVADVFARVAGSVRGAWNSMYSALVSPVVSAALTIYSWVMWIWNLIASIPSRINSALGGIPGKILGALGLEHGGITGAAATGGARGGLTRVAERGGELIRLPTGSMVYAHGQSEAMMAQMGGGGPVQVTLSLTPGGTPLEQMFWSWMKNRIRVKGGDPAVLGR